VTATHLADTTAWAQLPRSEVAADLVSLIVGGAAATCALVDLEVLAGIEDGTEHGEALAERRMFPTVPIDDRVLERAAEIQGALAGAPVPVTALVVAAAAERAGLIVLHHDDAFDRIAAVTGQPVERVG
jgi:predicted nucleic acid-binding protein